MPELAEVEFGRALAESVALDRTVVSVWCDDDPIVFERTPAERWSEALVGARVIAARRRGKHLWFELDRRPWPLFHFGMTGAFRTPNAPILELASSPKSGEAATWPPRFAKIVIEFDDGARLAMTNKRRLGRLRLRDDPPAEPPISHLGFDPFLDMPTVDELRAMLERRRTVLKGLLLNQSFAAGVGNWLADEILYQAGIDPRRRANTLRAGEIERLHTSMRDIVAHAVSVGADKTRFPDDWLFHRRWGRPSDASTPDGHPIELLQIAGRTTAWVPAKQR